MTNKAALGLMGGGSLAAGLGTGYGVGVNTKPFDYRNYMNVFYANLIEDAKAKVKAYKNESDEGEKTKTLKEYRDYVCEFSTKESDFYNSDSAKQQLTKDKALCEKGDVETSNKSEWVTHFEKWPQSLEEEWADFIKYINN